MRRHLTGGFTATAGVTAVIVGLAAMDDRVRDQLAHLFSGREASGEIVTAGAYLQTFVTVVIQAVRDQSIEHAPLVIFALAALVLVLFMLRT